MDLQMKVLAVVPYQGLKDQIMEIASTMEDIRVDAYVGELAEASRIAREHENEYDVVLSRGGTAEAISKSIRLPVVLLRPTVFDLLRVSRLAEMYNGKYAFVGFSNITQNIETLFKITQLSADVITVTDPSQVEAYILKLKKDKYTMIVGDVIAVETAKKLHLNGILITSGEESIRTALAEAKEIYRQRVAERETRQFQQKIFSFMDEKVFMYSQEKELLFSSPYEEDFFPRSISQRLLSMVEETLETGKSSYSRAFQESVYDIRGIRSERGHRPVAVFVVRRTDGMPPANAGLFYYYNEQENATEAFIDNVGQMSEVYAQARRFTKSSSPILILREDGSDDLDIARSIHRNSHHEGTPLLIVQLQNVAKKLFSFLINNEKSPLNRNGQSVFVQGIEALNAEQAQMYRYYADSSKFHRRNRVIYAFTSSGVSTNDWHEYMLSIGCLQLFVPPLRDRKEDLLSLATLYLNRFSMQSGLPAIRFSQEASQLLTNYSWGKNIEQMRRVIKRTALLNDDIEISAEVIRKALEAEDACFSPASVTDLDDLLSGSLSDIIGKVLRIVLAQENRNKTRAAERLGISRSTFWRLMKQADKTDMPLE